MPLPAATCVTAEKSRCFAGSSPNFSRWPNFACGRPWTRRRVSAVSMMAGTSNVSPSTGTQPLMMASDRPSALRYRSSVQISAASCARRNGP